ncbi:MAG: hypothetical protein AB1607_15210 [Chloroflexota bacterium]
MNHRKVNQFNLLFIVLLVVTACASKPTTTAISTECIGSFQDFAYTIPENGLPYLTSETLPPEPWQFEEVLPSSNTNGSPLISAVATTRSIDGYVEIWINRQPYGSTYEIVDAENYQYLIYRDDTNKWDVVSAQVEDSGVFVDKLFVDRDGSIWGRNVWDDSSAITSKPILSRYNDKTKKFVFDNSVQNIPALWKDSDPSTVDIPFWTDVLLDADGEFWLFAHTDAIYNYNPDTQAVKRYVEITDFRIKQVVLAPNGTIYFRRYDDYNTAFSLQEGQLFQFLPETKKIESLDIPSKRWPSFGNILVDRQGRLWLDTVGWREPDGTWNMIYPNPWLYFWKMEWEEDYRWATPHVILENSDGRIWYEAEKGMAWLDPTTMQGCWFTTHQSSLVEDSDRNLWMIADGRLYKLPLNP